jgi:murein L,D-transpeptidase YcbB/YkuD
MERLRWLPSDMGDRRIVVNIPEFKVYGYDEGERALEMRVVVGSEYGGKETPVFSDEMNHVVFNPYWNVPYSIAANEMLPRIRENANYLPSRGFEVLDGNGDVLPAGSVNPDDIASGAVRIRQKPSPSNALGLVKFMFPNPHSIYLHDSPADHLFAEAERDFSHGCIRLEDPPRFGAFVLGKQGWSQTDVEMAIGAMERQVVQLDQHIPVYIMYMTAVVEDDGSVTFRDDVYGNDEALLQALSSLEDVTAGSDA